MELTKKDKQSDEAICENDFERVAKTCWDLLSALKAIPGNKARIRLTKNIINTIEEEIGTN